MTYPSGIDWQQRIGRALGVKLGALTYSLNEATQKIEALRETATKVREVVDEYGGDPDVHWLIIKDLREALEGLPE